MGVQNVLCQCHSVLRFNIQHHWILWYPFLCRLNSCSNNTIRPYEYCRCIHICMYIVYTICRIFEYVWLFAFHLVIYQINRKSFICSNRRVEEQELTLCYDFPYNEWIGYSCLFHMQSIFAFECSFCRHRSS